MTRLIFLLCLGCACLTGISSENPRGADAYIFYYFEGYAGEKAGLHMAYSHDLHTWKGIPGPVYSPLIGEYKVFRDPCVARTPDGVFRLVWTTGSSGFGYSSSSDGIRWNEARFITVEDSTRGLLFANVWAPEFYHEGDSMYIIWSSTLRKDYVPPKEPEKWWNSTWNHRFYYKATANFEQFTPTRAFWDPGFNAIDAVVYKSDSLYYLFFKDERRPPKQIMIAKSTTLTGPYTGIEPLAYTLTEGAIPIQTDTSFVLYYDYYHEYNGYRYITTTDMQHWSDEIMPRKDGFEDVIRHGSIVKVKDYELKGILEKKR